jgi:hypothetical protein
MAEAITFITGLIMLFSTTKEQIKKQEMTIRVCGYAAQHANSKVPMFVQRVDPLSPFFEGFFNFSGPRGFRQKKLQK